MVLRKFSKKSDAAANLYRAALYLGRGSTSVGINFLIKASGIFRLSDKLLAVANNPKEYLKTDENQKYWAEKILDQYQLLKNC